MISTVALWPLALVVNPSLTCHMFSLWTILSLLRYLSVRSGQYLHGDVCLLTSAPGFMPLL